MNNINSNLISEVTVRLRINDSSEISIGTGVIYYEDILDDKVYILTAAHCLFEDGDNFQKMLDNVCVDVYCPQEKKYKSIIVENINENLISINKLEDVAILIVDKENIDAINSSIPKIPIIKERKSFDFFVTKGFPQATKGKELVAVYATWLQEMIQSNRFQLQMNADYTATNVEGFSGAGIFLEANDEIYLYGIFTRFREEENGRVIYCQYIDSVNNLLIKNFLSLINYSYLGENGLNILFFANQVEREIKNLGPRFNEKLNFKLPIARFFNSVSKDTIFHQSVIKKTDKWLTEKGYKKLSDNELLKKLELELDTLRQEIKEWLIDFRSHSLENEISLLPLVKKVEDFNVKISEKWHEVFDFDIGQRREKDKPKKSFDSELSRLREIQDANRKFIEEIDELNIDLANHPTLIIQGEAGCGKSHLLGDIATRRKELNLPTILLLGTTFKNTTIEKNILNKLDLACSFKEFLENLNSIGLQINSRVLILIDAINEGVGKDLWENQIAGFVDTVAKYPAVGLVLTIRSTYFNDIIPDSFNSNQTITVITHEGFKGNEYEALKLFCTHYKLRLPNFPILNPEFTNPLFLLTICEAVKDLPEKSFPKGFNGINIIYSLYKQSLNQKFEKKRPEYKYQDIVSKAIEKLAIKLFNTEYHSLNIAEAVEFFNSEFPKFPSLFSDLIEESVLVKMKRKYNRDSTEEIVFFSYQRLGDFFMVEELLKPYSKREEVIKAFESDQQLQKIADNYQWSNRGIIEALAVLLPEKYDLELFELINFFFDKNTDKRNKEWLEAQTYETFTHILLDSLNWRELNSINDKKITVWLNKKGRIDHDQWWYKLTELASIANHPFNGDRLHRILLRHSMSERDGFWQKHIRWYSGYDDQKIAFPLQRLIDWAWSPNISYNVDPETARLVAQTLAWVLSSTDIALRDKTTKALVNLLEQQPETLIKTLTAFENIDDLYILDRLYSVAYGCILRTEKIESIRAIAQYIYDVIFKDGNPPAHLLVRDYARNAIEYGIYKEVGLDVDIELIRPPYNSQCDYKPLSNEQLDEKYKPKEDSGHWEKDNWGITAILHSMTTEYGRGTGGYGDFGRYVFQSAISHFKLPIKLNVDLLSNLAIEWIFEKYGYNPKIHGEHDRMVADHYYQREYKIERIGKKYQWIAFHQILAIIADNFKVREIWSFNDMYQLYKGAWQLYVRNIDPAYITKDNDNDKKDEENLIKQIDKEWWSDDEYSHWNYPDAKWIRTTEDLISPRKVIEKKNINEEWLQLQHSIEWREPKKIGVDLYYGRRKQIWYSIQGLLVRKSDKQKIIKYLKTKNFWGDWLPRNRDNESNLINREKFWSPAYLDVYKHNKKIWETIQDTKYKVIVATESANGGIEGDKSGANQSYNIPCKYIFEGMKLQYAPIDGTLKNSDNEIVVINSKPRSVLIRKRDLIRFLEENDLDIIWTLLGEKMSFDMNQRQDSYFAVPCGVYYLDNGKLMGELKMYSRD
ncbi:NACHT domain-containing protein [Proteiniphilum propionicum]|jgi:ABC-type oligopeptide transport system ATPase subunit|uniref:NACHT domain-containing protein n=1 Tax=Proteiniphilum propionicum TaxID=2829812 RepID=UPI001EEC5418|nr:hypothetical protein [Proteiniphilum propionicum]ULB34274.1 hypothetical protein KDN43_15135 [Proteiniphilum propionicum]